ncbi:MAG: DotA/TraY family protein [Gammaproteobacteria bacterium]
MIDLFGIASNDQSLFYLGKIFGQMGGVLPASGGIASISLLGTMFKTFNSIVLAVAALVVVYTIVVGLLATAHEGEFLGKKFHGLWTPIRVVLGIAALVPTATGYCALQIIMMWVIVQGIGAADTVWTTALKYVQVTGSPYAQPQVIDIGVKATLSTAFQSLSCAATAGVTGVSVPGAPARAGYYCSKNQCTAAGNSGNASVVSNQCVGDTCKMTFGPNGGCGELSYCNPAGSACTGTSSAPTNNILTAGTALPASAAASSLACTACKAQATVLTGQQNPTTGNNLPTSTFPDNSIIGTLNAIAVNFARADADYQTFYFQSSTDANNGSNGWGWITGYCTENNLEPCCNPPVNTFNIFSVGGATNTCKSRAGENAFPQPYTNASVPTDASSDEISKVILPFYMKDKTGGINFIDASVNTYAAALTASMIDQIQSTTLTSVYAEAASVGWIFAGAYYYNLAQQNNTNMDSVNPPFQAGGGGPSSGGSALANYRNNYMAASDLLTSVNSVTSSGGASPAPQLAAIAGLASGTNKSILNNFMRTVTGSSGGGVAKGEMATDPLVSIQSLGKGLLITIFVMFPIVLTLEILVGVASMFASTTVLGTGMPQGMTSLVIIMSALVTPLLLGFMAVFMAIGALLAVYTPLIPYIIFITGVIGWFGSTIEAMVAAPLVALGILAPGGQHEILGKAEPALMLIFGIFLRPTLMIFGLMAGMLLAVVAVTIVNASFSSVMSSIVGGKSGGQPVDFLSLIFFMVAYVSLILALLNKCFAMIYVIPTRTMRWIGGQGEDYGESEALGQAKEGIGAGASHASGAAAGAASAGKGAPKSLGEHKKAEEERDDKAAAKAQAKAAPGSGPGGGSGSSGGGSSPKK